MRILALSAVALATVATPAFAQSKEENFTGISAVAIVGVDGVSQDGQRATDVVYGGTVGYDIATSKFLVGGEVEGTFSTTENCTGAVCIKAGRDLYAGGRIGVPLSETALFYVKAGYTNARVKAELGGNTVAKDDLNGVRGGVGVEAAVGKAFFRAEYRYSNYEQDFSRHQGVLGVGFRF